MDWDRRLKRITDVMPTWLALQREPKTPEMGSSLAADDRTWPDFPASSVAWWGITHGTEHLHAALRLFFTQREGAMMPHANYTLLRAGSLGAAKAVAVLMPTSRDLRTTYALQIVCEDYRQTIAFREALLDRESDPPGAVAAELATIARLRDRYVAAKSLLDEDGLRHKITDTDLIQVAADLVYRSNPDRATLTLGEQASWRLNSAAAHGHLLQSLIRGQETVDITDGQAQAPVATRDDVAMQIGQIFVPLNAAWKVWDQRRQRSSTFPRDA